MVMKSRCSGLQPSLCLGFFFKAGASQSGSALFFMSASCQLPLNCPKTRDIPPAIPILCRSIINNQIHDVLLRVSLGTQAPDRTVLTGEGSSLTSLTLH